MTPTAVADLRDDTEVVRDVEHRGPVLRAQPREQVEDLRLRRDVEPRRRLVEHEQARTAGERHGDRHALLLSAGELMGILPRGSGRIREPHVADQLQGPLAAVDIRLAEAVDSHRLHDLVPDPHVRRERGRRVLRNEGYLAAAHTP
jgi:hypothetical protein